ncbi:Bccdc23 [Botrytis cinerea B05.10]|uniref:Bccdc23 n=3 Tax=Botryotinia fuckeliana TaxID=40559 RepID=A0A384K4M2_BOTFB|nr:Bccdc23 [Botrytis cinerea B05.10]ATZ57780.1 Bccdc23 [Botrytis cinerea B05.10]EMR87656.1 putative anaphase-promoting complex subunit 8 protein [Botrytis cinerea BcDW1]CCD47229.1 similar to anaphase-promoting complex subunit Apc8 [Botrytis cinerea T4]
MALTERETAQLRGSLQEAVVKCSERCLYQSAKWAAELLTSIPTNDDLEPEDSQMTEVPAEGLPPIVLTGNLDPEEAQLEAREINKYLLAKSFFDCREFDRCAAVFLPDRLLSGILSTTAGKGNQNGVNTRSKGKEKASSRVSTSAISGLPKLSQKSLFLALYAKFMSGEKKKDEDSEMVMGPHDGGNTVNKQLVTIIRILEAWFQERKTETGEFAGSQGWLEYLYGMVLAKDKNEDEAMRWLVRSVELFPMNWGCWLEMTSLISRVEDLNRISPHLPQNILSFIFHLHTSLELYQSTPQLSNSLEQLLSIFPTSPFLLTCLALLSYHTKDFVTADAHFSRLLALHPHRLDSLDHYSNILYVMNLRPKLSFLAHLCSSVDKFRPESCVVIGNYYSLLSSHEKAVQYFRRALTLDRSCLSAWTLMGHEYVELKNTHAAIESYRRAVDVNRRDYRAWYGLGQTYEVLEMHAYALWYYKRAAGLRPWDGKMWMAVGSCLQKMGRDLEGIKALKRALLADSYYDAGVGSSFGSGGRERGGTMDPEILLQIAGMYERLEDEKEARGYMELCMAQEEGNDNADASAINIHNDSASSDDEGRQPLAPTGEGGNGTGVTAATSKARMWLAKHSMRTGDYKRAMQLATELCQDGVEVEDAKALVREVRVRLEGLDSL